MNTPKPLKWLKPFKRIQRLLGCGVKTIRGCDAHNGGRDAAYLTRVTLLDMRGLGKVCIHRFHRSDADVMHDHPWAFLSLVLWGGYVEHTPSGTRRRWPGHVGYRPAEWTHRVELLGRTAVTLIWISRRRRAWGFHEDTGWKPWQQFFQEKGC